MCELTTALLVTSLIFTGAAGAYSADSAKKAGQYQAEVAKQNAELDDLRATQAATIGSMQEEQHRAKVRQLAGSQRADFAARGIDLQSGVVQDMLDETYTLGETDALMIRYNAMNEAWGYKTQATNSRNEGRFAQWRGKREATGTYLTTAASMAGTLGGSYGSRAPRTTTGGSSGAASYASGLGRGFGGG